MQAKLSKVVSTGLNMMGLVFLIECFSDILEKYIKGSSYKNNTSWFDRSIREDQQNIIVKF